MPGRSKNSIRHWLTLVATGATSLLLYLLLANLSHRPAMETWGARFFSPRVFEETMPFLVVWLALHVLYALAIRRTKDASGLAVILFILSTSAAFRGALLLARGFHDSLTPYLPTDPTEGPAAQLLRRTASWIAERWTDAELFRDPGLQGRLVAMGTDLVTLSLAPGLLKAAGLPPGLSLIYGWSPLAIKECAANGRLVPIGVLLFAISVGALQRSARLKAAMAYGASLTGGLWTAACLPLMLRPLGGFVALSLGIAAAGWAYPILAGKISLGSLESMPHLGGSLAPAAVSLARVFLTRNPSHALTFCLLAWLAFTLYRASRHTPPSRLPREALVAVGGLVMVSPLVLPWFYVPVAYLAAFSPNRGWLVLTATAPLTYLAMAKGGWSFWLGFAQYFPGYFALIFGWLGRSRRN